MRALHNKSSLVSPLGKTSSWHQKLILIIAMIIISDWLFYNQALGITVVMFLCVLAIFIYFLQNQKVDNSSNKTSTIILIASFIPLIEELNILTMLIGAFGIINFTLDQADIKTSSLLEKASLAILFTLSLPFKFLSDITRFAALRSRLRKSTDKKSTLNNWTLPLLMTGGFLFLFALANPLIGKWVSTIDINLIFSFFDLDRMIFWLFIAMICWPFMKPSFQKLKNYLPKSKKIERTIASSSHVNIGLLNEGTVFRSLILFNALFAMQTVLDFQYLWIGHTLPDGVTFSQYVHNGTYILIFTTLLAASFILFVTSAKKGHEKSPRVMGLLLAWIFQNIILVLSNVMRMGLYVEAFALTYLRLTVLIWLALVIIGLVLIIVRLYKRHSNIWLIKSNLISLSVILYLTSLANWPYLIADYNFKTAEQNSDKRLDIHYIVKLGPNTIPVMDRIIQNPEWEHQVKHQKHWDSSDRKRKTLLQIRNSYKEIANQQYSDWRQWNFRDYRLQTSLSQTPEVILPN